MSEPTEAIAPTDRLYVPHRKRLSWGYVVNDDGVKELRIDYGKKEISFDEERYFAFGERLVSEPSFVAEAATQWGPGYTWEELQPMLEALVAEGIVKNGEPTDDHRGGGLVPPKLPPAECPAPRMWCAADAPGITSDLAGRAVELGYIECYVPSFRIAHPAIDGDDRQVGEANVFPQRLRLERETEWRVCQYAGSRYRDDGPMNVTALRAMIKHWKPMMVTLMRVRDELGARMLKGRTQWTVGDLYVLSCVVLGLPAYQLLRGGGSSAQAPVHPVLSSLFRITDGIRMVTYEQLFLLTEKPRSPHDPMTGADIYQYAEQHGLFITPTGVCAGPRPLIDEFLANAVDGVPIYGAESVEVAPEVSALLSDVDAAIDYGLRGLGVWAIGQALLVVVSETAEELLRVLERAEAKGPLGEAGAQLLARLREDWKEYSRLQITLAYDREIHMIAYIDAYERSRGAMREAVGRATLVEALAPAPETAAHRELAAELGRRLAERFSDGARACAGELAQVLVTHCRREQNLLASTLEILDAIHRQLERPRPSRPLTVRDFFVFYGLRGASFPYVLDAFADHGVWLECTADAIEAGDAPALRKAG